MLARPPAALVVVVALAGFGVAAGATSAASRRAADAPRRAELIDLIEAQRERVEALDRSVDELRAALAEEEEAALRRGEETAAERARREELQAQAGTTEAVGSGVEVVLSHSTRQAPSKEEEGAYRVHDRDLQLVVNALFSSGATAVSVNERRIVATTAIRAAGEVVVVNFRPITAPYVIKAIGADRSDFLATEVARRFARWEDVFGLGFEVRDRRRLVVPAHQSRVAITAAEPVVP